MPDLSLPSADGFTARREVRGPAGTAALGEEVAGLLRGGEIILLHGALGAGKTCFTQGLCRGLAVTQDVVSPTFTLVNTYTGRLTVHHLDFYRIEPDADLMDIGVSDILDAAADGLAAVVVEWPELFLAEIGRDHPRFEILGTTGPQTDDRTWHLRGVPGLPDRWLEIFGQGGRAAREDRPC